MPLPEIVYASPPEDVIFPADWPVPSEGTIIEYRKYRGHGFFDAHAPELHIPTQDVPENEIGSDIIQQAGRYLLQKGEDLQIPPGGGITANQLAIPGIHKAIPSLSLMYVEDKLQVVVNPSLRLPRGFMPATGNDDVWSQGCLSLLGYGGAVNSPNSLGLEGWTLGGKKIDISVTDPKERRNVLHEVRHTDGRLFPDWVKAAARPMYVIPPERFTQYGQFIRGEDAGGYVPEVMPRAQYNALVSPTDRRMKLANFTIHNG